MTDETRDFKAEYLKLSEEFFNKRGELFVVHQNYIKLQTEFRMQKKVTEIEFKINALQTEIEKLSAKLADLEMESAGLAPKSKPEVKKECCGECKAEEKKE